MQAGGGGAGAAALLMTPYEAEAAIEALQARPPHDVGTRRWMQQAHAVERLNLQAHHSAASHHDEFVVEALVSHDKLPVLVLELIALECWKVKAFPSLRPALSKEVVHVSAYLVLQHEAQLINLLELCLFHRHVCESVGEDALVELADYCHRKVTYLVAQAGEYVRASTKKLERSAAELMAATQEEELQDKFDEVQFNSAICALTVLRYLTEFMPSLQPGVIARVLTTNDDIMGLIELLDNPPWKRRRKKKLERYADGKWAQVVGDERVRIGKHDAQVWLALNNLIVDRECRKRYTWDSLRVENVSKLKRHFNEMLFDQIPNLKDLARVVDEIILGGSSMGGEQIQPTFILEQVPEVFEGFMTKVEWAALVKEQKKKQFHPKTGEAVQSAKDQVESMLKSFEFLAQLEPEKAAAQPAKEANTLELELGPSGDRPWNPSLSLVLAVNVKKGSEEVSQPAEELGLTLQGRRWKLHSVKEEAWLPESGWVKAKYRGKLAEGPFSCPTLTADLDEEGALSERDQRRLPKVHWVTVGNLATTSFALQLKARRADSPTGPNRLYQVQGGVLNVRDGGQQHFV